MGLMQGLGYSQAIRKCWKLLLCNAPTPCLLGKSLSDSERNRESETAACLPSRTSLLAAPLGCLPGSFPCPLQALGVPCPTLTHLPRPPPTHTLVEKDHPAFLAKWVEEREDE